MREITELQELKEIELSIMKEIHSFCEENNITYYIAYGTLIGAIRHNGFIPWDDDIDIWMMRSDYEKFCALFPKYADQYGLYLTNSKTVPMHPRAMSKVCAKNTTLKELAYNLGDDIGVFVDIWPLDGVPNNAILRKMYCLFMKTLNYIFYAGVYRKDFFQGGIIRKTARLTCKVVGPLRILHLQEKVSRLIPVEKSTYVEWNGVAKGFLKKDFERRELRKFEDAYFWVPSGYDHLLTQNYGDYMTLPPEDKRVRRHISNTFIEE